MALAIATLAVSPLSAAAETPPAMTDAVRLVDGAVPGRIIVDLWDYDDTDTDLGLPDDLALNFFGGRRAALCVTTNGTVYPIAELGDGCTDSYDMGVGDLVIDGEAPMIAVLALDLDTGNDVTLIDGDDDASNDRYASDLYNYAESITPDPGGGDFSTIVEVGHGLEDGDHVVFFDTSDEALEAEAGMQRNHPVTVVDADSFTIPYRVAAAVENTGTYAYSDGRGAPKGIYWHETTIDGRPAVIITWYRITTNDANNDDVLTNTIQMVLRSRGTGDAATTGVDFDIEFNYGQLLDGDDGYSAEDPTSECDGGDPDTIDDCRWGVGWGNYATGSVDSVTVSGGVATVTLATGHGFPVDVSRSGVRLYIGGEEVFARVTSATTFAFDTELTTGDFDGVTDYEAADVYELYGDTPMPELLDGGVKSLTANSLNSSIPGRFQFGMVDGITAGFSVPRLGEPPVTGAPAPSWVARDGSAPSLGSGVGEWQQTDGSSLPLTVSSPASNQVRYSGDGIDVTFTGAPGSSAANGLVADANGTVECEICARLAAGEVIEAWMFSTPRLVAAHRIEDLPCQRFTIPVVSPLDGGAAVAAGAHTLQLALPTSSGMQAVNVGVTVGGPVPTSVPSGEGPAVPGWLAALCLLAAAGAVFATRRQAVIG